MFYLTLKKKIQNVHRGAPETKLFLWASDMSPAYVTMILYPCTWPLTPTAAWDRWSLISSSRWSCVNRKCNIRFLFFFLFLFWMHPTTTLSRKKYCQVWFEDHRMYIFFPHRFTFTVHVSWHVKSKSVKWVNQTIKTFWCLHILPPLPLPLRDTHKSKPRGCICLSDSGLH